MAAGELAPGTNGGCFVRNVEFPDGAQIKHLTFWSSEQTSGSAQINFYRLNVSTNHLDEISIVLSQDTSGNRAATNGPIAAGPIAVVNNQHFAYEVRVCLNDSHTVFYSARITYTYSNAGD